MKPIRILYRSVRDNQLWCESSSAEEVVRMTPYLDATFEKLEYYEVTTGWEEWKIHEG